jgi:hypothetical protein
LWRANSLNDLVEFAEANDGIGGCGMSNRCLRLFMGCLALLGASCSVPVFNEADQGQTREVYVGTEFSVSLPSVGAAGRGEPQISGSIVRFVGRRLDASENREVFDFKAEGRGETDVRIPAAGGAKSGVAQDYLIRVKVKSSSDGYSMPVRQ